MSQGDQPGEDVPADEVLELAPGQGPGNRYEIRILPDGRVVFGDLPQGLLEVARVVAGSEPEPQTVATESEQNDT